MNNQTNPEREEPTVEPQQAENTPQAETTGAATPGDRDVQVENVKEPGQGTGGAWSNEGMAGAARTQAGVAADALRRGEFMRDATVDPEADSDDKLIGLLTYVSQILIPFVMPGLVLLSESSKRRPFQRFHAVQSLALSVVVMLVALFLFIGGTIISLVPIIGWLAGAALFCLTPLLAAMVWLALGYYGYQAYQGKRFAIPGLTAFLRDQGWV